ncbi:hypothetical protein [Actinoplanes utahensis]|uniref:Uncharacterized protein n=1 Tax=Actinoplanes utahensis TaxID=1869 RepID=A0A0A6UL74_ACTUT|nr:hypothetical protein [Actinoplanes utahensis]KHD75074.1 hypothetical protein MB27_25220 [Actinoplanes utahensis]GIF28481.1 hypothetical protein Aut01nite_14670 [Actinoplanes utahensis]
MRQIYAHQATVALASGEDPDAPGAAITAALGGHGDHEPPHHTTAEQAGEALRLRVLVATEPDRIAEVRRRIDAALAAGDWRLITSGCATVEPAERPHGRRLLRRTAEPGTKGP